MAAAAVASMSALSLLVGMIAGYLMAKFVAM